jgi:hypothetical protein
MPSKRISYSLFDRAANLFAPVLLTRLKSPTLLLAFVVFWILDLLRSHESQFEVFWVVQLVARYHSAIFSASAHLFNKYFAL